MEPNGMNFSTDFLYRRSLEIILENQAPTGAYVACPNFPVYRFCWFRDSSYIAYALDLAGHFASAGRFHDWAAEAINRRAALIARAVEKVSRGEPLGQEDVLRTRYTLDGQDDEGSPDPDGVGTIQWTNHQLDGFGAWLWSLEQHVSLSGCPPKPAWLAAAARVSEYLETLWRQPCYDCWEEFPEQVHTHTLAAIYGGLKANAVLQAHTQDQLALQELRAFILEAGVSDGIFSKSIGLGNIDASLLGLATPFRVLDPDHPRMRATVDCIEERLLRGGVHRYPEDTYFGGGEWVLLAGWLGWYDVEVGRRDQAQRLLQWMRQQANAAGELPEQVPATLNDPDYLAPWIAQWGPVASPLLWSHAMYMILFHKLYEV